MQVSFNPSVSFRQQQTPAGNNNPVAVPVITEQKKPSGFRENISSIAKFFTTLSEMTKAAVKAIGYGLATGVAFTAGFWAFETLPKGFQKGNSLVDAVKNPIKNMSAKGKVITYAAMLGVAAYHLIKGKLNSNLRTANVDHALKTGHRPV